MTVAELHGKLSRTGDNLHERLEDLLTADVFGPLRYLPTGEAVLRLLQGAVEALPDGAESIPPGGVLGDHPDVSVLLGSEPVPRPVVQFWPRFDSSEPDLLLSWPLPNNRRFVLLVEVKFLSGKSGEGQEEDEDGQVTVFDQLGREHEDLCKLLGPNDQGALVYLTAHKRLPGEDIAASWKTICPDVRVGVYWISWVNVYQKVRSIREGDPLDPWVDTLWADIQLLLERKHLAGLRTWTEVLEAAGPRPQAAGWYRRPTRRKQYVWPREAKAAVPRWYKGGPSAAYRWPIEARRSSAIRFYQTGGDQA